MTDAKRLAERARLALARPELLTEAAYNHGAWVKCGSVLEVIYPTGQRPIGGMPVLGTPEAARAVAAGQRAFIARCARSATKPGTILRRGHELLIDRQEGLTRLLTVRAARAAASRPVTSAPRHERSARNFCGLNSWSTHAFE